MILTDYFITLKYPCVLVLDSKGMLRPCWIKYQIKLFIGYENVKWLTFTANKKSNCQAINKNV